MANCIVCGRELNAAKLDAFPKCIFHCLKDDWYKTIKKADDSEERDWSKSADKVAVFWQRVRDEVVATAKETYDFSYFVFPLTSPRLHDDFGPDAQDITSDVFAGVPINNLHRTFQIIFPRKTIFTGAQFNDMIDFSNAVFEREVYFQAALFNDGVSFEGARFNGEAFFHSGYDCPFLRKNKVGVKKTRFEKDAIFSSAQFYKSVDFSGAKFGKRASFSGTIFKDAVYFCDAEFDELLIFANTLFEKPPFFETKFKDVSFAGRPFANDVAISIKGEAERLYLSEISNGSAFQFTNLTITKKLTINNTNMGNVWFSNVDLSRCDIEIYNSSVSECKFDMVTCGDLTKEIKTIAPRG